MSFRQFVNIRSWLPPLPNWPLVAVLLQRERRRTSSAFGPRSTWIYLPSRLRRERLQVSARLTFLPTTIPARLVDVVASRGHSYPKPHDRQEASMQATDQTTFEVWAVVFGVRCVDS